MFLPLRILAQETETPSYSRNVLVNLEKQVQRNQTALDSLRANREVSEGDAIDAITSQPEATPRSTARGLDTPAAPEVLSLDFILTPDATMRVRDNNNALGLILTGKWISDYARLIKLEPEYQKTLAGYRSQAELHQQLIAEFEGVIGVKDKKIEALNEMRTALQERGDLYKKLADVKGESFLERVMKKLAFPAGIAVGFVAGVAAVNAAN